MAEVTQADRAIARMTKVQRAAVAGSIFLAGRCCLTTEYEDHPDIVDDLPETIADPVSGVLTPLGCTVRELLKEQSNG